jgi:predicted RNase H-like HicB family nuclease
MATEYTAVIKQEGDWWIGWIEEVPGVNCQERTRQELLESLRVTLQEAIEFNRQDAIASAGAEYSEEKIAIPAWREPNSSNTSEHKAVNSSEKALGIPGGGIPARKNAPPYPDIQKSVMALPERYAETLE